MATLSKTRRQWPIPSKFWVNQNGRSYFQIHEFLKSWCAREPFPGSGNSTTDSGDQDSQDSTTQLQIDNLIAKTRGQRAGGHYVGHVATTGSSKKHPRVLTKLLKFIMIKRTNKETPGKYRAQKKIMNSVPKKTHIGLLRLHLVWWEKLYLTEAQLEIIEWEK